MTTSASKGKDFGTQIESMRVNELVLNYCCAHQSLKTEGNSRGTNYEYREMNAILILIL